MTRTAKHVVSTIIIILAYVLFAGVLGFFFGLETFDVDPGWAGFWAMALFGLCMTVVGFLFWVLVHLLQKWADK